MTAIVSGCRLRYLSLVFIDVKEGPKQPILLIIRGQVLESADNYVENPLKLAPYWCSLAICGLSPNTPRAKMVCYWQESLPGFIIG
jgi:hypothetical protein